MNSDTRLFGYNLMPTAASHHDNTEDRTLSNGLSVVTTCGRDGVDAELHTEYTKFHWNFQGRSLVRNGLV